MTPRSERLFAALKYIAATAVIAMVAWYAAGAVIYMDLWRSVAHVEPGACRTIAGLRGAEDLVVTHGGTVIASVDPREEGQGNGALVAMAPDGGRHRVLWDGQGRVFHPHGIDYLRTADGREFVYAIDHAPPGDRVLVFRWTGSALELVREVHHPRKTLNDIAAVDELRFYVTVDHDLDSAFAIAASDYLRLPAGHVEWFDGASFRTVSDSLRFPNGIVLSPDARRVYVASMLGGAVYVFRRQGERLVGEAKIAVPGSPDNLSLAPDGALLVAAHPKILDLAHQRRDRAFRAPSLVLRIDEPAGPLPRLRTLFSDPGTRLSSASVAVVLPGKLLVGTVFDSAVAMCDMGGTSGSSPTP